MHNQNKTVRSAIFQRASKCSPRNPSTTCRESLLPERQSRFVVGPCKWRGYTVRTLPVKQIVLWRIEVRRAAGYLAYVKRLGSLVTIRQRSDRIIIQSVTPAPVNWIDAHLFPPARYLVPQRPH